MWGVLTEKASNNLLYFEWDKIWELFPKWKSLTKYDGQFWKACIKSWLLTWSVPHVPWANWFHTYYNTLCLIPASVWLLNSCIPPWVKLELFWLICQWKWVVLICCCRKKRYLMAMVNPFHITLPEASHRRTLYKQHDWSNINIIRDGDGLYVDEWSSIDKQS